jgi:PTS system fructose-specific IIC component/PTS system nitrogen regulatory IIA component
MFLHDVFSQEFIKVDLEAEDKDEAFEEMVDHYCQTSKLNIREELLEAVWKRENQMSTGIQKGIAIPHCKTGSVDTAHGVLGISRKGIDYDALDGAPVYLLFMIIIPQKDAEHHLRILRQLSELLEDPQFHIDLQSQKDAQSAYKTICKYEEVLIALE